MTRLSTMSKISYASLKIVYLIPRQLKRDHALLLLVVQFPRLNRESMAKRCPPAVMNFLTFLSHLFILTTTTVSDHL